MSKATTTGARKGGNKMRNNSETKRDRAQNTDIADPYAAQKGYRTPGPMKKRGVLFISIHATAISQPPVHHFEGYNSCFNCH